MSKTLPALRLRTAACACLIGIALAAASPACAQPLDDAAQTMADWVASSGDSDGLPFIVIDKVAAVVSVYDSTGFLKGSTAALVGAATGDDSVPGIGERELSKILPEERTTPAGRFIAKFGPAAGVSGPVLWVDFGAAVALHPTPTSVRSENRLERLASPTAEDNRITFGCINVPAEFFHSVVQETLGAGQGVVYILPETRSLQAAFPRMVLQASARAVEEAAPAPARPVATIADYLKTSQPLRAPAD